MEGERRKPMAEIIHLRCDHCGKPYTKGTTNYCTPCNIHLMYRAMPILLGILLIPPVGPHPAPAKSRFFRGRSQPYPHLHEIMD
jgi:hypothetical protein